MTGVEMIKGHVIVTLPKCIVVLPHQQFIEGLKRGKARRRRQALAQRQNKHGAGGRMT